MAKKGLARRKGKKNRKHGRSEEKCRRYRAAGTREKNKLRKVRKHIKRHPNDAVARRALDLLK